MGCDIHSVAEVRDPESGEWTKLGDLFPYPWSSKHSIPATDANLDRLTDGDLIGMVDHYIAGRYEGPKGASGPFASTQSTDMRPYYAKKLPQIVPGSELEQKIIAFEKAYSEAIETERDKPRQDQVTYAKGEYDPDAWHIYRMEISYELGKKANLSDEERQTIRAAIQGERTYDTVEEAIEDYGGDEQAGREAFEGDDNEGITLWANKLKDGTGVPFWDDSWDHHDEPLDSRNYTLFATLANVRNYDDGVQPIAEPRGLPDDLSEAAKKKVANRFSEVDGHSHSYHTLAQLKAYDLDGDVRYTGLVGASTYERLKEEGWDPDSHIGPETWSGGIAGGGIVTFTVEGYEKWKELGTPFIRQPQKVSFLGPDLHVTPDMLKGVEGPAAALEAAPAFRRHPSDTSTIETADAGKVDLWREFLTREGVSEDEMDAKLAEMEKNPPLFEENRYSYNGIKPYVLMTWLAKRGNQLGDEFHKMVEVFEQVVAERDLSDDDIRVVFFFDN